MARPRNSKVDFIQYLAVRSLVTLLQWTPLWLGYRLAAFIAWVAYKVDKRHRVVAMNNLKIAFGDSLDDAARDKIVRSVYRHFISMIIEIAHIPYKLSLTTWRKYINLKGHEPVLRAMLDRKPVMIVTGHYGNWEMAGYLFGVYNFSPFSVYRVLDNPYLDRWLRQFREHTGQRMIPKKGGFEQMEEVLRNQGLLCTVGDQDAGPKGLFVDFFGRPASTHKAMALMAMQHEAVIVIGAARRLHPNRFEYDVHIADVILPEDFPTGPDAVKNLTRRMMAGLEEIVKVDPTQYLWLHRRWKHTPPEPKKKKRLDGAETALPNAPNQTEIEKKGAGAIPDSLAS
jgi:Kdo2-lipid IVA lauroyltransferase/acyltransferase